MTYRHFGKHLGVPDDQVWGSWVKGYGQDRKKSTIVGGGGTISHGLTPSCFQNLMTSQKIMQTQPDLRIIDFIQ